MKGNLVVVNSTPLLFPPHENTIKSWQVSSQLANLPPLQCECYIQRDSRECLPFFSIKIQQIKYCSRFNDVSRGLLNSMTGEHMSTYVDVFSRDVHKQLKCDDVFFFGHLYVLLKCSLTLTNSRGPACKRIAANQIIELRLTQKANMPPSALEVWCLFERLRLFALPELMEENGF